MAHDLKADLFISLHANSSNSSSAVGLEFYFNSPKAQGLTARPEPYRSNPRSNPGPEEVLTRIRSDFQLYEKTEKSLLLSHTMQKKTAEQEQKGVIKRAPFFVIDHTDMPSVLVELGFITNRREARKLSSEEYQNTMARLLTSAIVEFKEKSDKNLALDEK